MNKEAMKLALEALENAWLDASMGKGDVARHTEAITALREALAQERSSDEQPAQPQQEPVALQIDVIVGNLVRENINKHRARELAEHFIKHSSPPPQPQQKPVAWMSDNDIGFKKSEFGATPTVPLYTDPPAQRTWVGLTDEEIIKTFNAICNGKPFDVERILELHRAIEAKLKEKNT